MSQTNALKTVAVYSLKGGVGKTTFAVNLAWASAMMSRRRTLLWDLDPQAAASWMLNPKKAAKDAAQAAFTRDVDPRDLCRPTRFEGLDLLAADTSLRGIDRILFEIGKRKRLAKLLSGLDAQYDRAVLDCPPGLTELSEQVLHAADIVIVPVIPSPLAQRALGELARFLVQRGGKHPPILPVFLMVDKRRRVHQEAINANPDWPQIAYASIVERMAIERAPLGEFAARALPAQQFVGLWTGIEQRLAKGN